MLCINMKGMFIAHIHTNHLRFPPCHAHHLCERVIAYTDTHTHVHTQARRKKRSDIPRHRRSRTHTHPPPRFMNISAYIFDLFTGACARPNTGRSSFSMDFFCSPLQLVRPCERFSNVGRMCVCVLYKGYTPPPHVTFDDICGN